MIMLRCAIIRGGTSKGIYFHENELPQDPTLRDKIILDVFGSPDIREIDGLGGADVLTSKVCIIGPSKREDADVDYTFGQVITDKPIVDRSTNCGNLSAGVGPFAIDEGLVTAVEPITRVRIFNTNTKKILVADVPVKGGRAAVEGDYHIDGVPGTGAKIALDFAGTGGTIRGTLLPTGRAKEKLHVDRIGDIQVSIVDAANPTVFASAGDIGIKGTESFHDLLANTEVWRKAELVRGAAAELLGFVKNKRNSASESPAAPFSVFVANSSDYRSYATGDEIRAASIDLRGVLWASGQVSKAYAVTGTICTGAAAMIEGTIVNEILSGRAKETGVVRIGHPSGIIQVDVEVRQINGDLQLTKATVFRTARRIMSGYVYLKPWTLKEHEHTQLRSR